MGRTFLLILILDGTALALAGGNTEVPVFFVANEGQSHSPARFVANGSGLTAYFLPGEIALGAGGMKVVMRFEGANPNHVIEGNGHLAGHANFLTGGETNWRVDLPLYKSVIYRELYPGIDMEYGGAERNLKSEFLVAPGADPSQICVRYVGAGDPSLDADGSLVLSLAGRELRERAPLVFQELAGVKMFVTGRFLIHDDGSVGFNLDEYDRKLPLVIDPVLSYSTLLGGVRLGRCDGLGGRRHRFCVRCRLHGFVQLSDHQPRERLQRRRKRCFRCEAQPRRHCSGLLHLPGRNRRRPGVRDCASTCKAAPT